MPHTHTDQLSSPVHQPAKAAMLPDSRLSFEPELRDQWRAVVRHHAELLGGLPGVQAMEEAAMAVPVGAKLVFEKEDGQVKPLPFDFASHDLPEPPEGAHPIAVMMPDQTTEAGVRSVALVLMSPRNSQNHLSVMYLEQPDMNPNARQLEPRWLHPGSAYKTGVDYNAQIVTENDETVAVRFGQRTHSNAPVPETVKVFRADVTSGEARLMAVESVDKRLKYSKRLRRWLGGVTLAAGLLGAPYQAEPTPPEVTTEYADYITDDEAVARVEENLGLMFDGKKDQLTGRADRAGHNDLTIPFDTLKAVDTAKDVRQVETAAATALKDLGIGFKIRYDHHGDDTYAYGAVDKEDLEKIKQTTQGILDGVNRLGAIVSEGEKFDVEIVERIDNTENGSKAAGNYSSNGWGDAYYDDPERPLINIALQDASGSARDTFVHEVGHHEHLVDGGIGQNFTGIDSEWLEYGKDGSGNGRVGKDIITEYAGTNEREDAAEMMEYLLSPDRSIDSSANTYVQQKLRFVLASLESRYPGSSAYILQYAEKGAPAMSTDQKVESALDHVRSGAQKVFVMNALLLIGTQIVHTQANRQKKAQSRVLGVR
ncbi:hypothetical protein E6P97_00350 [Patescibacteria group bacterium]|nr:MAG: hypothetical protein E6P97_00350 [Patescibacteria group bacterium]